MVRRQKEISICIPSSMEDSNNRDIGQTSPSKLDVTEMAER